MQLKPRERMPVVFVSHGAPTLAIEDGEAHRFLRASGNIEATLADFIYARLLEYPGRHKIGSDHGLLSGSF